MDDALTNLANLFPSLDKVFLEDVFVTSKKDFDKTVDQLLGMGIEMEVGKKDQKPAATPAPMPTPTPITKPMPTYTHQSNVPLYPAPNSPIPHHQVSSPHLPPPMNPNVPPPHQPLEPPVSYPTRNINTMYTTPPPIISSTPIATSPTPTAPPATNLNSSQVDQKRNETMKQELAMEYQRLNEKHKYNLELQQKLEQLSEFTTSEQKRLEEQRTAFAEEKRRFTEEVSARFKALEDDYQRQKEELQQQEETRIAAAKEEAEAKEQAKEVKRQLKQQQNEDAERMQRDAEVERNEQLDILTRRLQEAQSHLEQVLQEKNQQIQALRDNSEGEIQHLRERIDQLERQLKNSQYETSNEVLSYFSTVVSTLASGIHAVSIDRANNAGENGDAPATGDALKDLKRTFLRTVNDQLHDKLRESE